ncbi:MAG: alpha/beta fold hydrolase [Candidatus Acidiferrales bacterium]
MRRFLFTACASLALAVLVLVLPPRVHAQQTLAAITTDPAPDKTNPAAIETFQLPSHGSLLNALVYVAAGSGPHPVVVLLHGFPGNEKNLDLAQTIRRAGWDVLYFDYRGSWGSPGDFSFAHSTEDTQAAISYMRDPSNAKKIRADPARIVLIGHSMGGFMANYAAAQDAKISAVGLISAANLGEMNRRPRESVNQQGTVDSIANSLAAEGMAPLAGCTPLSLAREILANQTNWDTVDFAPKLASRPILVVTSDDGLASTNSALVDALKKAGDAKVTAIHMATDHSYSDHRIALETAVLTWLESVRKR